ncbi:MAG: transposase [Chloroflexi bacterium]|nr:transposase [Chloroflexota bacterium]
MKNLDYRQYYRRNLPHSQPRGATFLINFRLAGSLPSEVMEKLKTEADELEKLLLKITDFEERRRFRDREQSRLFGKWDDELHQNICGPFYLKDDRIAKIVADSIHYHDGNWFDVEAYCIMPNHVHLILTPYESTEAADHSLAKITHNIKRNSAKLANKILGREGAFWQHESYDHFARDEAELDRMIKYVLYNPVKANLVKDQKDWKWSYCRYDY